jgi:tryptophanyl-tRNA synthetase
MDCKKVLHAAMDAELAPIRARAATLASEPSLVEDALATGARKARETAGATMLAVREAMGLATVA